MVPSNAAPIPRSRTVVHPDLEHRPSCFFPLLVKKGKSRKVLSQWPGKNKLLGNTVANKRKNAAAAEKRKKANATVMHQFKTLIEVPCPFSSSQDLLIQID